MNITGIFDHVLNVAVKVSDVHSVAAAGVLIVRFGGESLSRIVPTPVPFRIVAPIGLLRITLNVSSYSSFVSFVVFMVTVPVSNHPVMVTVHAPVV